MQIVLLRFATKDSCSALAGRGTSGLQEVVLETLAAEDMGGLKGNHSGLEEEEEDENRDWSPAALQSSQQALLRISPDRVQRSLGSRAPSLRRYVLFHNTVQQLQAALGSSASPAPYLPPSAPSSGSRIHPWNRRNSLRIQGLPQASNRK